MTTLGAGLAALAVCGASVAAFPIASRNPIWMFIATVVAVGSGLFGSILTWQGLTYRVPLVDIEEPWNATYDKLRDMTGRFVGDRLPMLFISVLYAKHPENVQHWQEYIDKIPIPDPESGWLPSYGEFLENHHSPFVRQFYELAKFAEAEPAGQEFRRFAVRTYDVFYRSRLTKPLFEEWMKQERLRHGAEPVLVLLAYMEVARAASNPEIGKGATHLGFWHLAKEWHNNQTLASPKKTPTPLLRPSVPNIEVLPPAS